MKKEKKILIGILGQWMAAVFGISGLAVEICLKADIGYILITAGAVIGFIATKIRHEARGTD